MKFKKWVIRVVLFLVVINLALVFTGNTHLYKGIANTYLKGHSGPTIDERDIFHYRTIEATQPLQWQKGNAYNAFNLSAASAEYLDSLETVAFLIIKNDSILFEKYWDGYHQTKVSHSFSMGKSIIAALIGVAIKENYIKSEEDFVHNYLPRFREGKNKGLKIKHLLTMSSGMNFDESYSNPFGFTAKAYYGDDLTELTSKYEVTETPGKVFKYLSGNTQILEQVLVKATGMPVSEYMQQSLWRYIHATNDAYWVLDHEGGSEKAFTGVYATARDYAKIGQLYMNGGILRDTALINAEYIFKSTQPADLVGEDGEPITEYGYSWWTFKDEGNRAFYMRGINGQYVICLPSKNTIIVRLGRKRDKKSDHKHPDDLYHYVREASSLIEKK